MKNKGFAMLLLLLAGGILSSGTSQAAWQKTFGGTGADVAHSVWQTTDKGYIITGYTTSYGAGAEDVYLIKTDANGKKLWQKTFGDNTGYEYANCLQRTKDGGYIIAGSKESSVSALPNVYLLKTDSEGN